MKSHCMILSVPALVLAGLGVAGILSAQDKPQEKAKPAAQDAAAMTMPKPTPEHGMLKMDEGTWNAKVKMYPAPGAPAQEMEGVETNMLTMNGLWLSSDFKCNTNGFEGHGLTGYDTVKKAYVGTWIDNMSTSLFVQEGSYDKASKSFTFKGKHPDEATGKMVEVRSTVTYPDANSRRMEMFETGADGKERKSLEIQYTRASK